jgi:hypothetical protein
MAPWAYFNRPTNMAFHDLTSKATPPNNLRSLLGLSLKFIPNPRYNVPWDHYQDTTLPRLVNDLKVKAYMASKFSDDAEDDNAVDEFNPRMYIRTGWTPPEHLFPFPKELPRRLHAFEAKIKQLVQLRKCRSNLLPHQRVALDYLRNQVDLLVVQCDKNLGPALIEHKKVLKKDEKRFLNHHIDANENPFATFCTSRLKCTRAHLTSRDRSCLAVVRSSKVLAHGWTISYRSQPRNNGPTLRVVLISSACFRPCTSQTTPHCSLRTPDQCTRTYLLIVHCCSSRDISVEPNLRASPSRHSLKPLLL